MQQTCSRCRFWESTAGKAGRCRRRPPQPVEIGKSKETDAFEVIYDWPLTLAYDRCGEFESRALPVYPAPVSAN